jgi:hypothetical protein
MMWSKGDRFGGVEEFYAIAFWTMLTDDKNYSSELDA